jgi:hypothetical protein
MVKEEDGYCIQQELFSVMSLISCDVEHFLAPWVCHLRNASPCPEIKKLKMYYLYRTYGICVANLKRFGKYMKRLNEKRKLCLPVCPVQGLSCFTKKMFHICTLWEK